VPPQEHREILELCLDAVARIEVRPELRVEGRELAYPTPYGAETREDGAVVFVERGVAFGAEPLDALGAGEYLAKRGHFLVFSGTRRGAIELGELKRDQLLTTFAIRHGAPQPRQLRLAHPH